MKFFCFLCAMHANVQLRFNPALGEEAPYYRLKESYRDVRGNVHSLILLNIGFEPSLKPAQVRRIAQAMTRRFRERHSQPLFKEPLDGLSQEERAKADEWWSRMIKEGGIDRFDKKEKASLDEKRRYIDLDTAEHTDARNVGAEWLCKQTIDRLHLEHFLKEKGWTERDIHTALNSARKGMRDLKRRELSFSPPFFLRN